MRTLFPYIAGCLLIVVLGCGKTPEPGPETAPAEVPLTVLAEQSISGRIEGEVLQSPAGLAVDRLGAVYLVDAGNNRLIRFDRSLTPVRDFGGYGGAAGLFNRPDYVCVDNDLNVLVTDPGNQRISRFDSKLNFVSEILLEDEEDPLKFGEPSGVALGNYGAVWWCDRENNRVVIFDNVEQFDRFVGDYGYVGGQVQAPEKIMVGDDDNFYVCDAGNARLVVYDEYGNFEREMYHRSVRHPRALAFDGDGRIWVLDSELARLFCFDRSGRLLMETGPLLPGTTEPMKSPSDLAFAHDGRLIISDTGNHRLLVCRVAYQNP